jgi:hypothetical protein
MVPCLEKMRRYSELLESEPQMEEILDVVTGVESLFREDFGGSARTERRLKGERT